MLSTIFAVADAFSLTLDGAHRIFGYNLDDFRKLDELVNGSRTRILENFVFNRDLRIDLPVELAGSDVFGRNALVSELVTRWKHNVPARALSEVSGWQRPGTYYIQVGRNDSLGSHLPPDSVGLVVPIDAKEQQHPDPRKLYLLQFGNGYRCSRCVVADARLIVLSPNQKLLRNQEFAYPSEVRIVGRVRAFALKLPAQDTSSLVYPPGRKHGASLVLPWEHASLSDLFLTKYNRFRRPRREWASMRDILESVFHSRLSRRTERRYRYPTNSLPHADSLMQISVLHTARYSDSIRILGHPHFLDQKRFSLEPLLKATHFDDVAGSRFDLSAISANAGWGELQGAYVEWPTLLSLAFPHLELKASQIVRLGHDLVVRNVSPQIVAGSFLLLDPTTKIPEPSRTSEDVGWRRPLYAIRKANDVLCGHIESVSGIASLVYVKHGEVRNAPLDRNETTLEQVIGVAIPI